jgi:hypothetical protein
MNASRGSMGRPRDSLRATSRPHASAISRSIGKILSARLSVKPVATPARNESFNAIPQFSDGNDTNKNFVLIYFTEPREALACASSMTIRVQKEIQGSMARRPIGRRLSFSPEPRKGEASQKLGRLPFRAAFRFHSSAATTTAVVRPCFVILCGPSDFALSINSLN